MSFSGTAVGASPSSFALFGRKSEGKLGVVQSGRNMGPEPLDEFCTSRLLHVQISARHAWRLPAYKLDIFRFADSSILLDNAANRRS